MTRSLKVIGVCVALLIASTVRADSPPPGAAASVLTDADRAARLKDAVTQLVEEANALDKFKDIKVTFHWERPHPAIANWGPDMVPVVLSRLLQPFTAGKGAEYRDTYVRWHLMWIINKAVQKDRAHMGPELIEAIKKMPGPLAIQLKQEYRFEPPDVFGKWNSLIHSGDRVVGFPPFQHIIGPPESYSQMDAATAATVKQNLLDAAKLKWKQITDQDAITWNQRVRQLNYIVRQYRGELIYALIYTGDPEMAREVVREIERQAHLGSGNALDLLSYMYLAAFDGALNLYDKHVLSELSGKLQSAAQAMEGYRKYEGIERNFADYAFHMVYMLKDGGGFIINPKGAANVDRRSLSLPVAAPGPATPANLDTARIRDAMAKAVQALYKMEPTYTFLPAEAYNYAFNQEAFHATGNHSLAIWALLKAGESYQNPPLYRRLSWVLSGDSPYTYDRGIRATMLDELPHDRWMPWIHRDGLWFQGEGRETGALSDEGNFTESYTGTAIKGPGDNANGQYGVLGLWSLNRAGFPVKDATWKRIDDYWRKAQAKTPGDQAAGWGVYSLASKPPAGQVAFYSRISGPMTAGGVATLCLTERFLYGSKLLDPAKDNVSPQLRKGIRWLDENFSLDDKSEEADPFYYMWTIQRVGAATGYRTFNGVDWFRQVTARILNQQQGDGAWVGDKGRMLSTGFALLYLSKVNDTLAISKLRFKNGDADGAWQNHPHDIWNFVDYASDTYAHDTTWQIAEPSQAVYELMESPMLYMATDRAFSLSQKDVDNLRAYIDAGGLLLLDSEGTKGDAIKSFRELGAKLFPGKEFKPVPKEHELFGLHQKKLGGVNMEMIDNGLRPLVIHFPHDIGRDLQANDHVGAGARSFEILSNIYLYVTGMNPRRSRLDNNYVVQNVEKPKQPLAVARIKYTGRYDPEPGALQQLKALAANKGDVDLQVSDVTPEELSNKQQVAFLTTMGDGTLTDAQAAAIGKWVEAGGTLWLDAIGGDKPAADGSAKMLQQIAAGRLPAPVSLEDPIISGKGLAKGIDNNKRLSPCYRYYTLDKTGPQRVPRLQAIEINNRKAIIYSGEDITCGLAGLDQWKIYGYTPEFARNMVLNSLQVVVSGAPPAPAPVAPAAAAAH